MSCWVNRPGDRSNHANNDNASGQHSRGQRTSFTDPPSNQPTDRPTNQPTNQSASQPKPTNHVVRSIAIAEFCHRSFLLYLLYGQLTSCEFYIFLPVLADTGNKLTDLSSADLDFLTAAEPRKVQAFPCCCRWLLVLFVGCWVPCVRSRSFSHTPGKRRRVAVISPLHSESWRRSVVVPVRLCQVELLFSPVVLFRSDFFKSA